MEEMVKKGGGDGGKIKNGGGDGGKIKNGGGDGGKISAGNKKLLSSLSCPAKSFYCPAFVLQIAVTVAQ